MHRTLVYFSILSGMVYGRRGRSMLKGNGDNALKCLNN